MSYFPLFAFAGVGLVVFFVAWTTLAILVAALLAAAAYSFFRSAVDFDNAVREATMDLAPHARRRFYELYASRHPKDPAIAWFLAVGLGPAGANLYRGKWAAFGAAVITLNGLGAWWMESWFTTPYLVLIENRAHIAWTLFALQRESQATRPPLVHERATTQAPPVQTLVAV